MLLRNHFLILGLLLVGASPLLGSGEAGSGSVGYQLGFYHNTDDGEGNPFLDEESTIIEPVVVFDYNVSDDTALWGEFSYDYVSSASIERLNKFPAQSGASADYYFGGKVGVRHDLSDTLHMGGFLDTSIEYDYFSFGMGGDISKDSEDRNRTVKFGLNGYVDQIDVIRFNGEQNEGTENRSTVSGSLNWYQVMTPDTHGELGASLTLQDGFLETAYNSVVIEDGTVGPNPNLDNNAAGREIHEELPDQRMRLAVYGRVRHNVSDMTAVELNSRLYTDDWGINSVTLEPRLYRWLVPDEWSMRLRYRFYTQTAADDYQEHFTEETEFRTQDSDLGDYMANSLGVRFDWYNTETTSYGFSLDAMARSDGINAIFGTVSYNKEF